MDRKDFLASIGLSAATFALINCAGCAKSSNAPSGDTSGPKGIHGALTTYHTQLTGTSLRIYS
ncbi:hypothetical protein QG516_02655 [Pedobacter gandavensis]|uniref:hypothetical protein n=1 Tax=Pedobacter gandavensis TaxID=2679963 RepID=UPI002478D788|nr:hypothetical protein [Pedobacter gandavensis]WGQ10554.1 hypothetical protein QG516_02655 [Pedobacter gandavensis]